ncbi:MAG: hypothetical protein H2B00_04245 [Nitrosopumilaceae archaeon]|jgi:hypothetical protein|uniref:Uncharacterized protein n=2 Tax=Candidatus Nitrosomaritimum aestuariumsis TaxID=3342354 RepID=A0AC60W6N7_9ARCH|nr:hypothetical protein [Nitrosopumilaceae archaeon]MBA4460469.1 hypothetical protein [Nitrosopumilaceae archaeon]MBA4461706.1 hypothetical protein [Nitrosopumilaceae archaeon]MBA4462665.1 hypothetical protein [Nitrosopumilaceae archaeon]
MKHTTLPVMLPGVLLIIAGLLIMPATNGEQLAFAESDSESTLKVSDKLKKNPLAMQIIAEMEAQKLRYKQLAEESVPKVIPTREQILIEENRKISEEMLQDDLESMKKEYLDFTPKNAFAKFVEKLNSSHHGIFWDQFDYLNAKVQLAIAAKKDVLENGGTFYEAQREYFKYASMPRLEMISYIQELNVKYGFADEDLQSNFDPNGKLPRFEEDKDAPCYGCENLESVDNSNSQSSGSEITEVNANAEIDPRAEIKYLQEKLSNLRQAFLKSENINEKKYLVDSLNDTVKKIQELTY